MKNDLTESPVYFFGVTRFSIYTPGSTAWKLSKLSEEEYLSSLYSDVRLESRFDIFFNKAMPLYSKMAGGRFYRHIIQYSSKMPKKWRDRLVNESSKYPFVVLCELGRDPLPIPYGNSLRGCPSGVLAMFRVDDDDLLSIDYLDSLSKYAKKEFIGMAVNFGSGLVASYEAGKYQDFRLCHRPFLALGMAFIGYFDSVANRVSLPSGGNHMFMDKHMPTVVDSKKPMFVWTLHREQDTRLDAKLRDGKTKIQSVLNQYEFIDDSFVESYKNSFPSISADIDAVVENKFSILKFNLDNISVDPIGVSIEPHNVTRSFILDCQFETGLSENEASSNDRAFLVAFDFSKDVSVDGLTLSNNKEIGWYRYIPMRNGLVNGKFSFVVDQPVCLNSIKIIPWSSGKKGFKVDFLSISSC